MEKRAIKQINTGPSRHWLKTFHSFEMRYLWGNRSSKTNDKWKPRDANDETRMLKKVVHLSIHTGNNSFIIFFLFFFYMTISDQDVVTHWKQYITD